MNCGNKESRYIRTPFPIEPHKIVYWSAWGTAFSMSFPGEGGFPPIEREPEYDRGLFNSDKHKPEDYPSSITIPLEDYDEHSRKHC